LVEQRLEHMPRSPVEQRDVDVRAAETSRAEEAAESATDDQDPRSSVAHTSR
jgi:hypothetical protein